MPQGANLNLSVGSNTESYSVARTQTGDQPTLWEKLAASGVFDQSNVLSHKVTAGAKNRNVALRLTDKDIITVEDVQMVNSINGATIDFQFAKSATAEHRLHTVNTVIAALTNLKQSIADAEVFF